MSKFGSTSTFKKVEQKDEQKVEQKEEQVWLHLS
jgi:hypothetical protein